MTSPTLIAPSRTTTTPTRFAGEGRPVLLLPGLEVRAFRTRSLGNWTYLVVSGGEAALIDPQRDVERFLLGVPKGAPRLRYAFETHVHSDYLSGATRLADHLGTEVVGSVRAEYAFPHRAAADGEAVRVGVVELRALATPGHTREHVAWTLHAEGAARPLAVFSGGSLIPGGAGRTDVLGSASVPLLTWLQFRSIHLLAELPDETLLLPTHAGSSTCGATMESDASATESSDFRTVGQERVGNDLVGASYEAFRDALLTDRPSVPNSFRFVSRLNRLGPPLVDPPGKAARLTPSAFAECIGTGAWPIDIRERRRFATEHVRGSLNIEPTDAFVTQLGSLVPHGAPLAFVADPADGQLLADLVVDCYRVGYPVAGVLWGGIAAWRDDRRVVESYPSVSAATVADELRTGVPVELLDVRDPSEWREGTLGGARLISLGRIASDGHTLSDMARRGVPITIVCRGGARAALAASYLARRGIAVRPVVDGGVPDLLAARGPVAPTGSWSALAVAERHA